MNIRNILYYLGLVTLIIISFFLYSSRYYPLLNSDDALNILMTYYYKLPQDLYCWGQNRGGTLIPLISQLPHKIFGLSPVYSVSVSNYLILILGFLGFSSLFKNKTTKLLFAILWFFPPIRFIDLTRFPLGVQYSLIGFAIYFINRIDFSNRKSLLNHLYLILTLLLFAISVWVSDLAIVSISILVLIITFYHFIIAKQNNVNRNVLAYGAIGIVGTYTFIRYAKSFSTAIAQNYTSINDWNTFGSGLKILINAFSEVLFFRNDEILFSIYSWLVIVSLVYFIVNIINKKTVILLKNNKWLSFFALDFLVILSILLFSKWVYLNEMGRWYFITSYVTLSIFILLFLENLQLNIREKTIINSVLFVTIITGSLSTIHYLKFIRPKTLQSQIAIRSEFSTLGEIGIIGDFWNSYISACPDPTKIKTTAHEKSNVRNQELVNEVFAQPKLYLIKDMWLNNFPDTIEQFGYLLAKKGEPFRLANCDINEYEKIKRKQLMPLEEFGFAQATNKSQEKVAILKDSTSLKNSYVMWGPYFPLGIGDFVVQFKLTTKTNEPETIALFDVVADYGETILAKKEMNTKNLSSKEEDFFEVDFSTDKRYTNIEFRIYYYGNSDLIIENVKLIEK